MTRSLLREGERQVNALALDYDALQESLTRSGFPLALAEVHGTICGIVCSAGERGAQRWLDESIAENAEHEERPQAEELRTTLQAVTLATARVLASDDLQFTPLLPDEDAALHDQVQALASFCHGFLSGLGLAPATALDGEIEEILDDFAQISRAGVTAEDDQNRDQADFALAELTEYVRVSVQIVYEELRGEPHGARAGVTA
jgi:yecA family protein